MSNCTHKHIQTCTLLSSSVAWLLQLAGLLQLSSPLLSQALLCKMHVDMSKNQNSVHHVICHDFWMHTWRTPFLWHCSYTLLWPSCSRIFTHTHTHTTSSPKKNKHLILTKTFVNLAKLHTSPFKMLAKTVNNHLQTNIMISCPWPGTKNTCTLATQSHCLHRFKHLEFPEDNKKGSSHVLSITYIPMFSMYIYIYIKKYCNSPPSPSHPSSCHFRL